MLAILKNETTSFSKTNKKADWKTNEKKNVIVKKQKIVVKKTKIDIAVRKMKIDNIEMKNMNTSAKCENKREWLKVNSEPFERE